MSTLPACGQASVTISGHVLRISAGFCVSAHGAQETLTKLGFFVMHVLAMHVLATYVLAKSDAMRHFELQMQSVHVCFWCSNLDNLTHYNS